MLLRRWQHIDPIVQPGNGKSKGRTWRQPYESRLGGRFLSTMLGSALKRKCYNCQADITYYNRYRTIIFKYCPKCGLENNECLIPEKWSRWYSEIMLLCVYIFATVVMILSGGPMISNVGPSLVVGLILLFGYVLSRVIFKKCCFCHNPYLWPSDKFCGNCGKQL